MLVKTLNRILPTLIAIAISLMIFTASVDAADNSRSSQTAQSRADKLKGMPQDAAAAKSGVDKYLKDIFTLLNENQLPNEKTIDSASTHLKGCRKFLRDDFSEPEIAKYYMLTAWVNYFNGDNKNALRAIRIAYTKYSQSLDVRASDTAIAFLLDGKPSKPPRKEVELDAGKILDLDITSLRNDLLDRKVTSFEANCLNSTTFNYAPGKAALCVMFWQLGEYEEPDSSANPDGASAVTDPNGNPITVKPEKPTRDRNKSDRRRNDGRDDRVEYNRMERDRMEYEMMGRGGPGMRSTMYGAGNAVEKKPTTFEEEMFAFGDFYLDTYGNGNLKFLAVNTDQAAEIISTVNKLADNSWPWAQAMAKLPQSGIEQFKDIGVKKPILAIIDKTGTIKYAGSADGFMPKMMLEKIANIKFGSGPIDPNALQTDAAIQTPPEPAQDQATPTVPTTTDKPVRKNPPRELDLGDQIQAEKQLNYVKGLFLHKQQRVLRPTRGIKICREIIRDYPDSKYADEARTILRENVDPQDRKHYKITDEELGL